MADKLNGRFPAADDGRPLARGELRALDQAVRAALPKTTDRATRFHLEDVRDQIAKILDPKFVPPAAPAGFPVIFGVDDVFRVDDATLCFPDYIIRRPSDSSLNQSPNESINDQMTR
jgi:hypothetical protein